MGKINRTDVFRFLAGTLIMAFATKNLFDPLGMVTGGVSGLSIVIKYVTGGIWEEGVPLWMSNLALNVPLFLFAAKVKGMPGMARTILVWAVFTAELYLIPEYPLLSDNTLLTAVYGGVCYGAGTGMLLLSGATTGGTDMLADTLRFYLRHYSVAQILLALDGTVVVLGSIVFGIQQTLYALIAVFIAAKVTDAVIGSCKFAKLAFIISEQNEEIAGEILGDLERGATGIYARGMYSGKDKKILFCVVSKKEIIRIKDIVHRHDPRAFLIVSDVTEALGEGFLDVGRNL